jgi:hypothetical protein
MNTIYKRYENLLFAGLLLLHTAVLVVLTNDYSISYEESIIYFDQHNILSFLTHLSTDLLGQTNIGLRAPFILFYVLSVVLLYLLLDGYFKSKYDRLITVVIFMLLPGINSATLLVNSSMLVVFLTLLYLYIYKIYKKECYIYLTMLLFIDNSFAILFLALFFRSLNKKDNILLVISLLLFGISMSIYGFTIDGRPRGFLLDTVGLYSSIFSPFVFLYYFYSIYRAGIRHTKDMFWYLSITSLGLSLLFSLRQHVDLEDFAPFVVIGIPIMVRLFLHSLRVRLKQFRLRYYIIAILGLGVLAINFLVFIFNKSLYLIVKRPSSHFAYRYHIAYELSLKLKQLGITKIYTSNKKLQKRLRYYGIVEINNTILSKTAEKTTDTINIVYFNKDIAHYKITRL